MTEIRVPAGVLHRRPIMTSIKAAWRWIAYQYGVLPELASAITMLAMGLWFGFVRKNAFQDSGAYHTIAEVAPQFVWSAGLILLGFVQLAAVVHPINQLRDPITAITTGLWVGFAVLFFMSNPASVAAVTYALFSVGQAWCFWRQNNPPAL